MFDRLKLGASLLHFSHKYGRVTDLLSLTVKAVSKHLGIEVLIENDTKNPSTVKSQSIIPENDTWWKVFRDIKFSSTANDAASAYLELAEQLKSSSVASHSYVRHLAKAMATWSYVWSQRNIGGCREGMCPPKILPVASRSSMAPSSTNATCAIFTVVYNEPVWLPIWIRYYSRHADLRDMWILDHNTNDGSTNSSLLPRDIRYRRLYGEKRFSPHHFLNRQVELHQQRLLRYGYKCVLFVEVDEIVAPHPELFPFGLQEYFKYFLTTKFVGRRPLAYHISENNDTALGPMESGLNWTQSILAQRTVWHRDIWFDKPLLTKEPLQYGPGFHEVDKHPSVYPKHIIRRDKKLFFMHLHYADLKYCLYREMTKYRRAKHMVEEERMERLGDHWWNPPQEIECRNTRRVKADRMPSYWSKVEV